jgi:hypothetical protein
MSVVNSVIALQSQLVEGSGAITATISNADFFEFYEVATGTFDVAEGDADAAYVRVVLNPAQLNFLLTGVLELVSSAGQATLANMTTYAVAEYAPTTCEPVPLFVCDIPDAPPGTNPHSIRDFSNAGRIYGLTATSPPLNSLNGNFGLLDLGAGGAAVQAALAGNAGVPCNSGEPPVTEPGATIGPVSDGINTRFGEDAPLVDATAATNVQEYPPDATLVDHDSGKRGDGDWDPDAYFNGQAHFCAGAPCLATFTQSTAPPRGDIPEELANALETQMGIAGSGVGWVAGAGVVPPHFTGPAATAQHLPTRYQTYLWEIGVRFFVKGGQTWYPTGGASAPAGWTEVNPLANSAVTGVQSAVSDATSAVPAIEIDYTNTNVPIVTPPCTVAGCVGGAKSGTSGGQVDAGDFTLFDGFADYCVDPPLDKGYCRVRHRTILAVVVDCQNLVGNGKVSIGGVHAYARFFLTQMVPLTGAGANKYIRGELVGLEGITGSGVDLATGAITGNVRLID